MDTTAEKTRASALVYTFFKARRGKPSEIAKAFKALLNFYESPENVVRALPYVKEARNVIVWSKVADWPPEALEMLDSGKVHRSLVYELARRPTSKDRVVEILREVSTIPSWGEGKMFIQRVFQEPGRKLDEIKHEVSCEYQEEVVCLALVAIPHEMKEKLNPNKVEKAVQRWIKKGCPEIPEVNIVKPSSYSISMPRWMYEELKKHGNPVDVLGRIIRDYCKF
jgi:hypothetical protein